MRSVAVLGEAEGLGVRLTPAQIGMHALLGHRLPFCMPAEWSLADIIRHGRELLTGAAGMDFGYDPAAWHEHLVASDAGGYRWSNKHRGFARQIALAGASSEWQQAVASLRGEQDIEPVAWPPRQ
jgi:hypothetical protein